tara:strand:+ start:2738 stop:3190 length:453 start_codon:yes stop_codon:yes gene_type:complete
MIENQTDLFNIDIVTFKKYILEKYKIPIHVISAVKTEKLTFDIIERCTLDIMKTHNPELIKYWRNSAGYRTRVPEFTVYYNIFTFFCKKAGYTYTDIGKYIHRTHASIIHQLKTANNRLSIGDRLFMHKYVLIDKELKKYVGTIPKNTKV